MPEEASGFAAIAPYLQHPLVLAGFVLFLVFGLLRAFLGSDKLQQVGRRDSGRLLATVLRYGFVLALAVLLLGFGLVFYCEFRAEQARVERDTAVASAARDAEERLVGRLIAKLGEQGATPEVVAAVARAVGAVAAQAREPETAPEAGPALADLAAGDTASAEALLRATAEHKEAEGTAALAEAAQAWRDVGALAFLDDTTKALDAYRRAAELEPDDVWTWIFVGRLEARAGNLAAAGAAFARARDVAAALGDERDVMVADGELGDLARAEGRLEEAAARFVDAHAIALRLAAADPRNTEWQRDLAVSHDRIGDVRLAEGDLAGALAAYAAGLAIRERLAAADPRSTDWQCDLIVSNVKLAEIAVSAGERGEARRRYSAALAIARDLTATGRLAPADAWLPPELERRLAELEGSTTE